MNLTPTRRLEGCPGIQGRPTEEKTKYVAQSRCMNVQYSSQLARSPSQRLQRCHIGRVTHRSAVQYCTPYFPCFLRAPLYEYSVQGTECGWTPPTSWYEYGVVKRNVGESRATGAQRRSLTSKREHTLPSARWTAEG